MKSKSLVLMIVSLGFGLVAAIGISQVMGRHKGGQIEAIPKRAVLVASVDLEHNSLLTEENVKIEEWPQEIIPENTASSLDQIVEMATLPSLGKGMPINLNSIVHKKQLRSINVPKDHNVITIKVPADDNFYGLLRPGDKVNVIGHIRGKPAKTFLRGLRVWSVNAETTAKSTNREEAGASGDAFVGILANERQAEMIMQVQKEGSIKLVLRGDHAEVDLEDSVDTEGLAGLGLMVKDEFVESPQFPTTETSTPTLPIQRHQPVPSKTMKIWNKDGVETVTFRDGLVVTPGAVNRPLSPTADRPPLSTEEVSKSDDSADVDDYDDRARGLEEDQY